MKLDFIFKEQDMSFAVKFGEVHEVPEGGFKQGYEAGVKDICEQILGGEW